MQPLPATTLLLLLLLLLLPAPQQVGAEDTGGAFSNGRLRMRHRLFAKTAQENKNTPPRMCLFHSLLCSFVRRRRRRRFAVEVGSGPSVYRGSAQLRK